MSKLSSEMKALAKKAGGSFKTVNDRIHITKRFSEHLRALNIQIQRVEQIKVRHIECYIEERLELDIGLRTLQNEMAALRAVLRQAGRRQVVEHPRLTNKALGVSGASRNGTRRARDAGTLPAGDGESPYSGRRAGSSAGDCAADGAAFAGGGTEFTVAENVAESHFPR